MGKKSSIAMIVIWAVLLLLWILDYFTLAQPERHPWFLVIKVILGITGIVIPSVSLYKISHKDGK